MKHPIKQPKQPIVVDENGVACYQGNAVVQYIMEHGGFDPKHLAMLDFPAQDQRQFEQLLGMKVADVPSRTQSIAMYEAQDDSR